MYSQQHDRPYKIVEFLQLIFNFRYFAIKYIFDREYWTVKFDQNMLFEFTNIDSFPRNT
jgi:hypothetical protein